MTPFPMPGTTPATRSVHARSKLTHWEMSTNLQIQKRASFWRLPQILWCPCWLLSEGRREEKCFAFKVSLVGENLWVLAQLTKLGTRVPCLAGFSLHNGLQLHVIYEPKSYSL